MTETEILPQQSLKNGTYFTAYISFSHVPGQALPTADDINTALDNVSAGMACDSVTQDGQDGLGNIATAGIGVFATLNCHVDDVEEDPQGGVCQNWIVAAFNNLAETFSVHTFAVKGLVTVSGAKTTGGGILDGLPKLPTAPFAALTTAGIAVIVIVLFIAWNEAGHPNV